MNKWVVLYRLSWILFGVLFVVIVITTYAPQFRNQSEMQKKKVALKEEIRKLRADTEELLSKQERFKTNPEFVEQTAKETGMARPDDTVIKFNE